MPRVGGVGLPSQSEIHAWDITHLADAARDWTASAQHWEASFSSIHQATLAPGGTAWGGAAAEAAQQGTLADLVKVRGWADALHESAAVARRGADTLQYAKQRALNAVEDAQAAGYRVGEDLSVTPPPGSGVAGAAEAQVHASAIQERAAQLAAHDKEIASKINTATAPLHQVNFSESDHIQTVDRTWKQEPTQPPRPTSPSADEIRRVLDELPVGNSPDVREVRSQQDLDNLWTWMKQNGLVSPNRYGSPGKGEWRDLPDGTGVGRREAARSTSQPVLDVRLPGKGGYVKVHINPQRGGVPDLTAPEGPAPAEPPARPTEQPPANTPAQPTPVEAPTSSPPPRTEPVPERPAEGPRLGGGGGMGGGGGGALPGIGIGGMHTPSEEVE